ncbi:MAG: TetR/AcrR family transcriptional regulator [Tagaea sp.]
MARPRLPEPISPRGDMLRAATRLLRRGGLAAAGVNRIVAESGAPKGSLYHFFPDGKDQIAREALAAYAERVAARVRERLEPMMGDPAAVVRGFFAMGAEAARRSDYALSCPAGAVALDLEPDDTELRRACDGVFARLAGELVAVLAVLPAARRAPFAGLMVSTMQGAYIRARAARSPAPFDEAGEQLALLVPTLRATTTQGNRR